MTDNIRYITQLTAADLRELKRAANLVVGPGIRIDRREDSVEIGIDEECLKFMMYAFIRQAWPSLPSVDISGIDLSADVT